MGCYYLFLAYMVYIESENLNLVSSPKDANKGKKVAFVAAMIANVK